MLLGDRDRPVRVTGLSSVVILQRMGESLTRHLVIASLTPVYQ